MFFSESVFRIGTRMGILSSFVVEYSNINKLVIDFKEMKIKKSINLVNNNRYDTKSSCCFIHKCIFNFNYRCFLKGLVHF